MSLTACKGKNVSNEQSFPAHSIINLDETSLVNQATELVLYSPNEQISAIQWRQLSGPILPLLTAKTKVIAFTPEHAGEYLFEATFTLNNEEAPPLTYTLIVTEAASEQSLWLNTRLGHVIASKNKASLQALFNQPLTDTPLQWQQLSGPSVEITDDDPTDSTLFFNAPNVSKDTLLSFSVTGNVNGVDYQDKVALLIEPSDNIPQSAYFDQPISKTFPYIDTGPYAENLVPCVYSNQLTSSCTLAKLPLIAQQTDTPTIDDIMARVVVSHQWMGDRFKDFLTYQDTNNDFKRLLRATTAIVIAYDIRPSFYWAATGAIYLDPENLWLTPDERDTINKAADFRSDFGKELQFLMPWRYVKNNTYASYYLPQNIRSTRTTLEALPNLAALMYHELSHANDFFPATEWHSHQTSERILDAALKTSFESDALAIAYPLNSSEMQALAQVSFSGATATSQQKSYTPSDISTFFTADQAIGYYNYSSLRENYAMLFEALMMQSRYGISRDIAVSSPASDNYIVDWGQRDRVAVANIKDRVAFVAQRILPEFDHLNAINALPSPQAMISGLSWQENLTLGGVMSPSAKSAAHKKNNVSKPVTMQQTYYHKALPTH